MYPNVTEDISSTTNGFRPVFTLKNGIKIIEGNGADIPYVLGT